MNDATKTFLQGGARPVYPPQYRPDGSEYPYIPPQSPTIELNEDQKSAFEALTKFLDDPKRRVFGVFGAAGTGKTTVISEALRPREEMIAFSAPTHKATGILASKAPSWIDCQTIHRLLACKKTYDKEKGDILFLPDPSREMFGDYSVIVVDECSMIGETMYEWIEEASKRNGTKIIWLGDVYQLPPVNDGEKSPAFDVECVHLTEIMRHGGCIQTACNAVREAMIEGVRPPIARPVKDEHGEILKYRNSEAGIAEFLGRFLENPASSKALAFKNDDVDFLNGYLRVLLYGKEAAKAPYIVDERLVLTSTYESPTSGGIYHTGTEITLIDVQPDHRHDLVCFRLQLSTDYGADFEAFSFGSRQQWSAYTRKISRLKEAAKAGNGWKPYFSCVEDFARLRPGYATTIHKSQGSSYERVFLLQSELLGVHDSDLLARLLYVAYSRAQKEIVLV